jgi:hypothetical protein
VWLLVGLFVLSLPGVTKRIYASDEVQYYAYLRSLWFDHDLSFENEYQYFYEHVLGRNAGFHETLLERETEAGRRINFGTIGCAILWLPFYAAGDVTARLLHASGRDVAVDGYSKPYIAAVCYGSAIYGFAALLLSIASARRLGLDAAIPALAVWVGTPLLFYMYVAPPMAHACSAFAVALLIWIWLRIRTGWPIGGVVALGAVTALTGMVREQDVLLACGPALDCMLWAAAVDEATARRPGMRALISRGLAAIGAFAVVYLPQALAYISLNGHLGPSHLVMRKMTWTAPHAFQVLASPEHGFLFWTPLAILAIAGLAALAMRGGGTASLDQTAVRRVGGCMLLMVALQVYSAGSVESWTVAGAFGQRRFVALTSLLVVGLAALATLRWTASVRRIVYVAAAVAIYWNVALMAEFATSLMDRQRLELARNAYDAFVTVPRMAPDLAYRYLFDRASFYQTRAPQ